LADFKKLMSDNNGFRIPQYEIRIGKGPSLSGLSKLDPKSFPALSITVNQSIGPASSAQIAFICPYNASKSEFVDGVYDELEPGQMIDIKMGYKSPESVFVGIVASINTSFTPSGVVIGVTCYDAKMALFHNIHWKQHERDNPTIKGVVTKVLAPCLKYGKIDVVGTKYDAEMEKGQVTSMFQDNVDDYRYIMRLAALTNSSFFARAGTVYFTENLLDKAKAEVKLGWGKGLMNFSVDIDISGQIGSVEIAYRTGGRKEEIVTYEGEDVKGKGELASESANVVEKKVVEITDVHATNDKQAKITAKNKFLQSAMNYVIGRGSTIGLPEIEAGTAIDLTGLGKKLNGEYFLTQVTHQFDAGGFLTNFTCQKAKI